MTRGSGFSCKSTVRRIEAGFTLMEMLIAIVLLTLLLLVLFGGMRTVFNTWDATETVVERNERARQGLGFIARLLRDARIVQWRGMPQLTARSAPTSAFLGDAYSLSFIGPGLPYLGLGGSMQYDLFREENQGQLVIRMTPFRPDRSGVPEEPRVLLEDIGALRLAYFGRTKEADVAKWHSEWGQEANRLPDLVSMEVGFEDGRSESLVVAPLRSGTK